MPVTLYIDENFGDPTAADFVNAGVALGLQAELFKSHNPGGLDPDHLALAVHNGWTILTRDHGFKQIQRFWYMLHAWRPAAHHHGILHVTADSIKAATVIPEVIHFLSLGHPLENRCYLLKPHGTGVRWHTFRPFAEREEPPL